MIKFRPYWSVPIHIPLKKLKTNNSFDELSVVSVKYIYIYVYIYILFLKKKRKIQITKNWQLQQQVEVVNNFIW